MNFHDAPYIRGAELDESSKAARRLAMAIDQILDIAEDSWMEVDIFE